MERGGGVFIGDIFNLRHLLTDMLSKFPGLRPVLIIKGITCCWLKKRCLTERGS